MSTKSPSERIRLDMVKNYNRYANGGHYPLQTLIWAQQIYAIALATLFLIPRVILLLGEALRNSKFTENRRVGGDAFQDLDRIGDLNALWKAAVRDHIEDRGIIVAVDTVAVRPLVTITKIVTTEV
jgi:hypothetical protein